MYPALLQPYIRCGPLWNPLTRTSLLQRAQGSRSNSGLASPGSTCLAITRHFQRNLLTSVLLQNLLTRPYPTFTLT